MRILGLLVSVAMWAQTPPAKPAAAPVNPMEESLRKQRESIEKQRQSVQKQVEKAVPTATPAHPFFASPWTPAPAPLGPAPGCEPTPEEKLGPIVAQAAAREGLTPDLLSAVIQKESSGKPCAVSTSGAMGLMQLMPETAAELGVADPFDERENVDAGARYLRQLLARYDGETPLALAAYNAGPSRVDVARAVPKIPETLRYVSAILGQIGAR